MLAGKRAKLWTTFNEPGVAAICGHIVGNHPPGKMLHFRVGTGPYCQMDRYLSKTVVQVCLKALRLDRNAFLEGERPPLHRQLPGTSPSITKADIGHQGSASDQT